MKRLALTVDGRLTYCNASLENIGKGRCNHIGHINNGETREKFLQRVNFNFLSKMDKDIIAINNGIRKLDKIMQDRNIPPIEIKCVGGYSIYREVESGTKDIDSINEISQGIKDIVNTIAEQEGSGLEKNWLNDEVLQFTFFSDKNTLIMLKYLQNHEEEFYENNNELGELKNIKIKFANIDAIIMMKLAAMTNRAKDKDLEDFTKLVKFKKYDVETLWELCKKYKLDFEKDEFVNLIYISKVYTNDSWIEEFY